MTGDQVVVIEGVAVIYGPVKRVKPKTITLKISSSDLEIIDKAARIMGMTRSEFIRKAALSEAKRILDALGASENNKTPA